MNIFQRLFRHAGPSAVAEDTYTEPGSGLVFPMELGGLRRLETGRAYAEGDRHGQSIPYGGTDAQATIYITTIGQTQFPDGGDGDFVREQLESAMAAVTELERLGRYQSVNFFTAAPEKLGTDPANLVWSRGAFFALNDGRPLLSFTYITALRNKLIKLRISASDPENKAMMAFPDALGDLISKQRSR